MTNRAFITTAVLFATLSLNGCGREAPPTATASSAEQLTAVNLRIHGFMKSNSGATWMAWPNAVKEALEGSDAVSHVEMHLDRDIFVVTFDAGRATVEELKSIIRKAGYTSSVATEEDKSSTSGLPSGNPSDDPLISRALARAQAEDKIVVLDFQAVWCVPCRRMEQETFADPEVAQLLHQTVFVQIDTDAHPELAKHFGVVGLPDIRFLAADGKELLRMTDFQDARLFSETLGRLLDRASNAAVNK